MSMRSVLFSSLICISFQLISSSSKAQHPVYNLVLEGGGMKGMTYPGAFMALDSLHMLDSLKRIAGTSSGALNGALLAIGMTPQEIYEVSMATNHRKFNQKGFPLIGPYRRMKRSYGINSSDRYAKMIGDVLEKYTGNRNITFRELHDSAQLKSKYKDLYVTGTCLNNRQTIIFSYESFPDMKLVDAIRISSTLPMHFETIFMTPQGKIISHKKMNDSTLLMVDGGLLMNYPIHVFDSLICDDKCVEYKPNPNTLGLRLDNTEQIEHDRNGMEKKPSLIDGFSPYMRAMYDMSFEKINRLNLSPADWARTISIDGLDAGTKVRKLKKEEKEALVASGKRCVIKYFESMVSW
ncbi:MAG: hypothetical protein GC181_15940 [Bacteroidetes bacterium]|nr:hypothetical protein [Bacteroidota bacterium]